MKKLAVILIGLFSASSVFAADGSSGCGPGWYLFKNNSLVSSALRTTTNSVLGPTVTLGMTFGTSNCSKHSIVKNEMKSLHFATMSYFELQSDIAKGNGEHLAAFANTLGCEGSALSHASKMLQKNYNNIYPSNSIDPEKTLLEVYKVILSDPSLIKQCAMTVG